jgi:hypothetical protein
MGCFHSLEISVFELPIFFENWIDDDAKSTKYRRCRWSQFNGGRVLWNDNLTGDWRADDGSTPEEKVDWLEILTRIRDILVDIRKLLRGCLLDSMTEEVQFLPKWSYSEPMFDILQREAESLSMTTNTAGLRSWSDGVVIITGSMILI